MRYINLPSSLSSLVEIVALDTILLFCLALRPSSEFRLNFLGFSLRCFLPLTGRSPLLSESLPLFFLPPPLKKYKVFCNKTIDITSSKFSWPM